MTAPLASSIEDLKAHVATHWAVPVNHQKLVIGSNVVNGFEPINKFVCNGTCSASLPLDVTVITTKEPLSIDKRDKLQKLSLQFSTGDSFARQAAMSLLKREVDVASEAQVDFFVNAMEGQALHKDASVTLKRASLQAISHISPKGHARSIQVALHLLEERNDFVRLTAVETIGTIARRGDGWCIGAARRLLRSSNSMSIVAGLMVLGEVAEEETRGIMDLLTKFSGHKDEVVREAASEAVLAIIRAS